MRTREEIQTRLTELGYYKGTIDGVFGELSVGAFNHYAATKGIPAVEHPTLEELNAVVFPEEQPAPKEKRASPLTDWFTNLLVKQVLNQLKDAAMLESLKGYRTIITGSLMVIVGVVSVAAPLIGLGAVPGLSLLGPAEAIALIGNGFGLIFLRKALP